METTGHAAAHVQVHVKIKERKKRDSAFALLQKKPVKWQVENLGWKGQMAIQNHAWHATADTAAHVKIEEREKRDLIPLFVMLV